MEGITLSVSKFRVLDCYRRGNVGTFTTHTGQLELLESETANRFVADQSFKIHCCYEPTRAQSTTIPGFGYAILIREAIPIKEVNTE